MATDRPRNLLRGVLSEHFVLFLSIAYFLAAWVLVPELAGRDNLVNLFAAVLPLLVLALGQTVVLITGGIDLSMVSVVGMVSVAGSWVMAGRLAHPPEGALLPDGGLLAGAAAAVPAAVAVMLAAGLLIGTLNGLAVSALSMPPFVVTLATLMGVGGAALWLTRSQNIAPLPEGFLLIGGDRPPGLWYALAVVAALTLALHVLLSRTLLGRWLYAVGLNQKAARVSGVPAAAAITAAYALSGLCAAVASMLYTARLASGSARHLREEQLLDVIGAAVIGGASLTGGKGAVLWTLFGVLFFALVINTLDLLGLDYFTTMMVKGAIILAAALLDRLRSWADRTP